MKFFYFFLILVFLQNCSFDDKSGIWKNSSKVTSNKEKRYKDFKKIVYENENFFNQSKPIDKKFEFTLTPPKSPKMWNNFYFNESNNFDNFSYNDSNQLIFQSGKVSRHLISNDILFINDLLITSDSKGNIIVYSLKNKKILHKYNFYKKKYKDLEKKLNIIIEDSLLYVSDNFGYLYVYDYFLNKIKWAKKFNAPFRSNMKIKKNKLFLADENNTLLIINSSNGNILRKIPTEQMLVKNNFVSNISMSDNSIFFINTFGSLYSIDAKSLKMNWFLNLNTSIDINLDNLFYSSEIKINNNNLTILTKNFLHVFNHLDGSMIFKIPINTLIPPIINNEYIFLVNNNNYLISIKLTTGEIIYSYELDELISNFLGSKKKKTYIKFIKIINNQIFIFLNNSYIVKLSTYGVVKDITKLPRKINSNPIFIDETMIYLSKNNKFVILN
tara:strand:+ start:1223 stop:2551 length:1329 start_codon:yes stop_codon:yes gene_type:complete